MITIIKLRELFGPLSMKGMGQVLEDWRVMMGVDGKAAPQPIRVVSGVDALVGSLDPAHVVIQTTVAHKDVPIGPIHFAFPNGLVFAYLAELLMIPEAQRAEKAQQPLSEFDLEAFGELANLLCGSWNRTMQDLAMGLRISQSVDDLHLFHDGGKASPLEASVEGGRLAAVGYTFRVGESEFDGLLVMPFEVAIAIAELHLTGRLQQAG